MDDYMSNIRYNIDNLKFIDKDDPDLLGCDEQEYLDIIDSHEDSYKEKISDDFEEMLIAETYDYINVLYLTVKYELFFLSEYTLSMIDDNEKLIELSKKLRSIYSSDEHSKNVLMSKISNKINGVNY